MGVYLENLQNGLLLRDSGRLDESVFKQIADYMVYSAMSAGGCRWWQGTGMASPEVRAYIDQRVADEGGSMGLDETMPFWMAMADEENDG